MKVSAFMSIIRSLNHLFNSYLSWIVLLMAVLAYLLPTVFSWMTPYIAYMLQFVMFAMGLTLTAQVFLDVFKQPMKVILVSVIQFLWMPLAGFLVALIFNFPPEIGIGFILLGACPGGTASNVMTFLANGNVPLSVSATTVSTLLAPVLTPLFVVLYAGATSSIEIQFMPMFISIVKIVLVPIILGIVLNYFIGSKIEPVKSVCPTIAAIAVLLILAAVTAVNQKQIAETGFIIFVACLVQNVSGYIVTYFICKALSIDVSSRRAMQIEVAMQNSALSVSLALKHFTPQAAVAGAVFSIIHNFTAEAKPGQKVAIVGPTGSGKTTRVNLLMRFYEIQSGKITIDGVDTKTMTREEVHDAFSMVLQDTWLFEGSIQENLVFNQRGISDEAVEAATRAVGVHHFIRTLPNGYDTVLDDSVTLSVGQKQLLTIARALLKDAPLLILDEATSSVDTRAEELIQKAMDKLMEGRTSFVIAHRLSTIRNADLILVMKDGNIIE